MCDAQETPMREAVEMFVRMTFDADATQPLNRQVEACADDIQRLHDPDSTTGVELVDFEILDQLSEHDTVRMRSNPIVLHAPLPQFTRRYADDCVDSAQNPCRFLNRYDCTCGENWIEQTSVPCDDHCPTCNLSISPSSSRNLVMRNQIEPKTFHLRMMSAVVAGLDILLSEMSAPDFEPGHRMTAMGLVEPIEPLDLEAIIAEAARALTLKRAKWALDQGVLEPGENDDPASMRNSKASAQHV